MAAPIVELEAPDLRKYRDGGTGVDYVHTWDSGEPGRHVMITALTHGNEICGAIALDYLFGLNLRPKTGKLSFGFVNVQAFERFDPEDPYASRFVDEDFNRMCNVVKAISPNISGVTYGKGQSNDFTKLTIEIPLIIVDWKKKERDHFRFETQIYNVIKSDLGVDSVRVAHVY